MISFLLCAPAGAQPAARGARAVAPGELSLELGVRVGAEHRTYNLAMLEGDCADVKNTGTTYEDSIQVCASPSARGAQLRVSWTLKSGPNQYRSSWATVVAPGGTVEVGQAGGAMLTLKRR